MLEFTSKPKKATANIAVYSKYWLWINNRMVSYEGGLKRGLGFSKFQVMPQTGGFNYVKASFESVKGAIKSSFEKISKGIEVKDTVPPTSNALVKMLFKGEKQITLNGEICW